MTAEEHRAQFDQDYGLSEISAKSRKTLKAIRKSVKLSIAKGFRDYPFEFDAWDRGNEYVDRREEDLMEAGYELGKLRAKGARKLNKRLMEVVGVPLFHFHGFLVAADHLNFHSSTTWRWNRLRGNRVDVLLELHSQALLVAEELLVLLSNGLGAGTQARWRTLYELTTVAKLISSAPDNVAARYKSSHIAEIWRRHQKGDLDDLPAEHVQQGAKYRARIEKKMTEIIRKHGEEMKKPYGWAANHIGKKHVTFEDIVIRVYGPTKGLHYPRYVSSSQHLHGGRAGSVRQLTSLKTKIGPLFAPAPQELYMPMVETIEFLNQLTSALGFEIYATQWESEAAYWAHVCDIMALDVQTEIMSKHGKINPGYLAETMRLHD